MGKRRVRLVTHVWGKEYVDRLLSFTLSSVLSPGNLPALSRQFDCEVVVVTEEKYFDYARAHPVAKSLGSMARLRLVALDDLIGERWQYGLILTRALHRGMTDLGAEMTETFFLFLNGDFVLADGSYERLIPHILGGERAVLSPSYCVNGEKVSAMLEAQRSDSGAISVPARTMAKIILENRHNTVLAKTVNQHLVHFRHMDQFYWKVDSNSLIGFQMPVSLVGLRPEVALQDIGTFWDWGVVYDFCPSKRLKVLGDSDEFLMLELRGQAEYGDSVLLGSAKPDLIASRMLGYITQYQVDNAQFPLTLHAADIPSATANARKSLAAFRDTLLECLPSTPIDHRDHAQWHFHTSHFEEVCQDPSLHLEMHRLKVEIERLRTQKAANELKLRRLQYVARSKALPQAPAGIVKRTFWRAVGRFPFLRPWHPFYLSSKRVAAALRRARRTPERRTLFIYDPLFRVFTALPPHCSSVSSLELLAQDGGRDKGSYDECFIDVPAEMLDDLGAILDAARARMKTDGKLTLHVTNRELRPSDAWTAPLARYFIDTSLEIRITSSGSWPGSTAVRVINWGAHRVAQRPFGPAMMAFALVASMPLACLAFVVESRLSEDEKTGQVRRHCTSLTIEVDLAASAFLEGQYAAVRSQSR